MKNLTLAQTLSALALSVPLLALPLPSLAGCEDIFKMNERAAETQRTTVLEPRSLADSHLLTWGTHRLEPKQRIQLAAAEYLYQHGAELAKNEPRFREFLIELKSGVSVAETDLRSQLAFTDKLNDIVLLSEQTGILARYRVERELETRRGTISRDEFLARIEPKLSKQLGRAVGRLLTLGFGFRAPVIEYKYTSQFTRDLVKKIPERYRFKVLRSVAKTIPALSLYEALEIVLVIPGPQKAKAFALLHKKIAAGTKHYRASEIVSLLMGLGEFHPMLVEKMIELKIATLSADQIGSLIEARSGMLDYLAENRYGIWKALHFDLVKAIQFGHIQLTRGSIDADTLKKLNKMVGWWKKRKLYAALFEQRALDASVLKEKDADTVRLENFTESPFKLSVDDFIAESNKFQNRDLRNQLLVDYIEFHIHSLSIKNLLKLVDSTSNRDVQAEVIAKFVEQSGLTFTFNEIAMLRKRLSSAERHLAPFYKELAKSQATLMVFEEAIKFIDKISEEDGSRLANMFITAFQDAYQGKTGKELTLERVFKLHDKFEDALIFTDLGPADVILTKFVERSLLTLTAEQVKAIKKKAYNEDTIDDAIVEALEKINYQVSTARFLELHSFLGKELDVVGDLALQEFVSRRDASRPFTSGQEQALLAVSASRETTEFLHEKFLR